MRVKALVLLVVLLLVNPVKAIAANISLTGHAKVLNTGNSYLDFAHYNSNVGVDDGTGNFSGYAFLEDLGWVAFGTVDNSSGPVNLNMATGAVTGKAKVLTTDAYLDFTGSSSNVVGVLSTGVFTGYVFSQDVGWINFNDTGVSVATPFLPTAPTGLSGSANSTTTITWTWTDNSTNETGFRVEDNSNTSKSGSLPAETISWDESGLSPNTTYSRHVHAYSNSGSSLPSASALAITLSTVPTSTNVTSTRLIATWYNTPDFTFTNNITGGFGGEIAYFRYAWDTSPTHTWTGTETQWSAGTLTFTATSDSNSWYLHLQGYNTAGIANGNVDLGPYYYDATTPADFILDNPESDQYISSDRPSFGWFTTTDSTSDLATYRLEIDNGDSGSFIIYDIPASGTSDYETEKFIVHYKNFYDLDPTNNYISVHTKSSSEWGDDNNNGKLKEGERVWKVTAIDNAGNETSEQSSFFLDTSGPKVEVSKVNNGDYAKNLVTSDTTPAIHGKITDSLDGDSDDNEIAAGPKSVEIKFEKKNSMGAYKLYAVATVNVNNTYWSEDRSKIEDNSDNTSNKYANFSYTPKDALPLGIYKITLIGKDGVDNTGDLMSFTLTIKTSTQFFQIPAAQKAAENIGTQPTTETAPDNTPAEIENVPAGTPIETPSKEQAVIPEPGPSWLALAWERLLNGVGGLWWTIIDTDKMLLNKLSLLDFHFEIFNKQDNAEYQPFFTRLKIAFSMFGAILFDKEPTTIMAVRIDQVTPTSAIISWKTNHYATSKVNYGLDTSYGKEIASGNNVLEHKMVLTGLEPGKLYYFEVMSQGKNYAYDAYHTFNTPNQ
jgi:hypothetical protein